MRKVLLLSVAIAATASLAAASPIAAERPAAGAKAATATAVKEIPITTRSPQALEAFRRGRDLAENIRTTEAIQSVEKAIQLDPDFAMAHAMLGTLTPGAQGLLQLEHAATLNAKLPEAERLYIEIRLAERRGEDAKVRAGARKLVVLAPGDWRAHFTLGMLLNTDRKWDEAVAELKKATELSPAAGPAWNTLGYAYLSMNKPGDSVEAFRKYAALMPSEPNPQDSLAEALMAAGKFDEAEAAFKRAAELDASFFPAWSGVAQVRFLRGDWNGGREALAKARSIATRSIDQLDLDDQLAWSYAGEGNPGEAVKTLEKAEQAAASAKDDVMRAFLPLDRAFLTCAMGNHDAALSLARSTREWAEKAGLPGGELNDARRLALTTELQTLAMLGGGEPAQKTLAQLQEQVQKKTPTQAMAQSSLHFGEGLAAFAQGNIAAAIPYFSQCLDDHFDCRLWLAMAQKKAGNAAAAESTATSIMEANRRDSRYLYARYAVKHEPEQEPMATAETGKGTKAR